MKINQALLDEVTRIKVNIMQQSDNQLKSIMIAAAGAGEGISTVAANLALSIGLREKARVLVVDANMRQPVLHTWFNRSQQDGFIDLVTGQKSLPEVIKNTSFANISIITSGVPPAGEKEGDMSLDIDPEIKKTLEEDFDWVVYDTPPVNSYPDALMLAPLADGVILVIMAEHTRRAAVQKVKKSFESINATILGGVLNGRRYVVPKFIYKRL